MIRAINTQDLWGYFKKQRDYFSLVNVSTKLPLLEREDDYAQHRLFFTKKDAETYRQTLIELDLIKPSELDIYPTNVDELFEDNIIASLSAYANTIFELPLKVSIALMMNHDIIVEDDILDELLYVN